MSYILSARHSIARSANARTVADARRALTRPRGLVSRFLAWVFG